MKRGLNGNGKKSQVWVENLRKTKNISSRFLVRPNSKRAQVWVETVIYTLIAFSLMGLVLGFARPKIQELQDKAIIEQSIDMMQEIDLVFDEIKTVSGNKRVVEIGIEEGFLRIDGENDKINFEMEGGYTYSEPGEEIKEKNLIITSEETGKISFINVSADYSNFNLTYQGQDISRIISKSPSSYRVIFSNQGKDSQEKTVIDIDVS